MAIFSRHLVAAALLAALSVPSFAQMPAPQSGVAAPMAAEGHVMRKKNQHIKRHKSVRHHARRMHHAHRRH